MHFAANIARGYVFSGMAASCIINADKIKNVGPLGNSMNSEYTSAVIKLFCDGEVSDEFI